MQSAEYKPSAVQHVKVRKRRHGRVATACGIKRNAGRLFIAPDLQTARDVVEMYPGRTVCAVCELVLDAARSKAGEELRR